MTSAGVERARDQCLAATQSAQAYRSWLVLLEPNDDEPDGPKFVWEWTFEYVAPEKHHVNQIMPRQDVRGPSDFDEWITIGGDHYSNAGVCWIRAKDPEGKFRSFLRRNRSVLADRYLELMRIEQSPSAHEFDYMGQHYLMLEFRAIGPRLLWSLLMLPGAEKLHSDSYGLARIWIALDKCHLCKAEITASGLSPEGSSAEIEMTQVFTDFNTGLRIDAPDAIEEGERLPKSDP